MMGLAVKVRRIVLLLVVLAGSGRAGAAAGDRPGPPGQKVFRAGAYAIEITPSKFPVIVNGMFEERTARRAFDPLHARCLVLDDGSSRLALVVVDSCMLPRDLLDRAKALAEQRTGIPTDHILISATHTHSAPSAMGVLGSRADPAYPAELPPRIARGIQMAAQELRPARIGWATAEDWAHTHCRRWIRRPDRIGADPFGNPTVRANMHPGYQNPDVIGPSGPVDPGLSVLAVQSLDGRPIALLANYSMHYYGSPPLSADYFGRFAEEIKRLIGAEKVEPAFVGIMAQGTSGDLMWMDYSRPRPAEDIKKYAAAVARVASEAYARITYHDWVPLAMHETKLTLRRRVPDERRLAWAQRVVAGLKGRRPHSLPEIYAHEQILLHQDPVRELKLQAIRIGDLGITAIPNEVFGLSGLTIKAQSPLQPTFTIELANGAEGYIPPPEQHQLGGYTTWPARTAGLEVQAEPKIVDAVLGLLEDVSGRPRRPIAGPHGPYARAVLASKPLAYWRLAELAGATAVDATANHQDGRYDDGIAFYLEGPQFSRPGTSHRAVHFAGGRLKAAPRVLGNVYTVEMWFWNGLPNNARPVTGYLFSRGVEGAKDGGGDHLGLGGTRLAPGRLLFSNGNQLNQVLTGTTLIDPKSWNYMVLVRDRTKVRVYLNGNPEPEIRGEVAIGYPAGVRQLFIGGRNDHAANWEGKIDGVAVYGRGLTADEIAGHFQASGRPMLRPLGPLKGSAEGRAARCTAGARRGTGPPAHRPPRGDQR